MRLELITLLTILRYCNITFKSGVHVCTCIDLRAKSIFLNC